MWGKKKSKIAVVQKPKENIEDIDEEEVEEVKEIPKPEIKPEVKKGKWRIMQDTLLENGTHQIIITATASLGKVGDEGEID